MQYEDISARDYLSQKKVAFEETGSGELKFKCVFGDCDSDSLEGEAHLYMSAATGQYQCKKCKKEGNLKTFAREAYGDTISGMSAETVAVEKPATPFDSKLVDICHQRLPLEIRRYLNERGISDDMIDYYKLGWWIPRDKGRIAIPVKDKNGAYAYLKLRQNPNDTEKGSKYIFFPTGSRSSLFGIERLENKGERVFICEGEFDCMILQSKGVSAVSSTAGAGTFKSEWVKEFEHFKEVFIVYDNDDEGKTGAFKVAKKLSVINGLSIFIINLPDEISNGKKGDVTDYFTSFSGTMDGLLSYAEPFEIVEEKENEEDNEQAESNRQIDILRKIVFEQDNAEIFLDQLGEAYAKVKVDGHYEVLDCSSRRFRSWLVREYAKHDNDIPRQENINKIILAAESEGDFGKKRYELFIRSAFAEGNIWYDLGQDEWQAVRIGASGWEITNNVPILFKRSIQDPQVIPQQEGDVKKLLDFVNISDPQQQLLFLVGTVLNFIPHIARPIQIFYGPQGSAKSTVTQVIKNLIDPAKVDLLILNDDVRELTQQFDQHYLISFDNLTGIKSTTSDVLCRAVTGGGFSKRKLYSNNENVIFKFKRAIVLNGINLVANKPDLLDRSLLFELERIGEEKRKSDEEFWRDFGREKPRILGGIFDILSKSVSSLPGIKLANSPRMADFYRWGCAVAESLGYAREQFFEAYRANIALQNKKAIEEDPLASAILVLMEIQDDWEGKASDLLKKLKEIASEEEIDTKSRIWPKSPSALSRRIGIVKINLMAEGIIVIKSGARDWRIEVSEECRKSRNGVENSIDKAQNDERQSDDISGHNNLDGSIDVDSLPL